MKKHIALLILPVIFCNACIIPFDGGSSGLAFSYAFKFSVKNETKSALSVKLVAGEIPGPHARYDELTLIPDSIYRLGNETWSAKLDSQCTIKPGRHNTVVNFVPIGNLGVYYDDDPRSQELREYILDKYISFILTISRGNTIVYRVAGWDVPDDDMVQYNVDDKMYGYYFTAEENYTDSYGSTHKYPYLTSKLFSGDDQQGFISSVTYYIKATASKVSLREFNPSSLRVDDNKYWRTH